MKYKVKANNANKKERGEYIIIVPPFLCIQILVF
jgi:hypothetical protein